jgi:hypothetical protein
MYGRIAKAMDRAMLVEHLAQAARHIAAGERHVKRQRRIVAHLKREGRDVREASDLLLQFEVMQALHIAEWDRLRNELAL